MGFFDDSRRNFWAFSFLFRVTHATVYLSLKATNGREAMSDDDFRGWIAPDPDPQGQEGTLLSAIPHSAELGMRLISRDVDEAMMMIPYDPRLIGDPDTGVMHGGAITALLDTCCGTAVMMASTRPTSTATLDLRINYMRPATAERNVYAHAHCYRATRSVGFVRAVAYHEDREDPIATASAAFILNYKEAPRDKR